MPRRRSEPPPIPAAELQVLKQLWRSGPATVREVLAGLQEDGSTQAYTTVQTLLHRLADKGYASVDRAGTAHVFAAAVSRESFLGGQLASLAEKVCDGAAAPLLLQLVQGGRFTAEEIARFRELLAEAEREAQREDQGTGGDRGRRRPGEDEP